MASNTNNTSNSRLLVNSANLRNALYSRNLYVPNKEYPLRNQTNVDKVVNAISSVISVIAPFKGFDLKDSALARVITTQTPLSRIGLIMLGKQFALNSISHVSQQLLPTIKISNLFDGNKDTKLFTPNINFSITHKQQSKFQDFLNDLVYYYPMKNNPFNKKSNNSDYIKNTGTGQLSFLYQSINQNIYKQNDNTLNTYAGVANTKIFPRDIIIKNKTFFNFNSDLEYPYLTKHPTGSAAVAADNNMMLSYDNTVTDGQEYAPDADFINKNFGTINKSPEYNAGVKGSHNDWINTEIEFSNDNIQNKLVWGRDGVENDANKNLVQLHGNTDTEINNFNQSESLTKFNIKSGLLEYTRNLLNATEGNTVDITRKAFRNGNKLVGFNGSALWRANTSKYAGNGGISDKEGVRQHTTLDQYDRFAKAIRFNGNKVYGGNENSVIYNTVMPRIHPIIKKETGTIDNKNLMFSIENLAVGVISKGEYGIMDDEYGSPIPLSEVGAFNGRAMWFPPFNMEIQETASARYESTVMVGRSEPMYNYQSSERTAILNFTLLIDYPQHLKNYRGIDKQKEIAEFFAFGGDPYVDTFVSIEGYQKKETTLTTEIEIIKGKTEIAEPEVFPTRKIKVVFPNDVPKISDNLNTIIDDLYKKYHYEIIDCYNSSDGTGWGLNKEIYFRTGLTETSINNKFTYFLNTNVNTSQYNQSGLTDQMGTSELNNALFNTFNDEKNRPYYSVYIHGGASKLYLGTDAKYNFALGERRAKAVKYLIQKRLEAMFGKTIANGIDVQWDTHWGVSVGDVPANADNATKAAIPNMDTKNERFAEIEIKRNEKSPEQKVTQLSKDDKTAIVDKQSEIEANRTQIRKLKDMNSSIYNERNGVGANANGGADTGILHGFQSVSGNYYYPVFHSQTPEDFHKRLTFLHQCTRQGASMRTAGTVDNSGTLRARNSVFGRQPICILRVGDFFYTKVIIETVNIDYNDTTWDMNPEGFGMQPMIAKVTLNMKVIGGQSLKGPIDALQNAVSFNYYANSTYTDAGMYKLPSDQSDKQETYMKGVLTTKQKDLTNSYNQKIANNVQLALNSIKR